MNIVSSKIDYYSMRSTVNRAPRYERRGRERNGKDAEFNPLTRVSDDRAR